MHTTKNKLGIIKTRTFTETHEWGTSYVSDYFPTGMRTISDATGQHQSQKEIPNIKGNKLPLAYWKTVVLLTGKYKTRWYKKDAKSKQMIEKKAIRQQLEPKEYQPAERFERQEVRDR